MISISVILQLRHDTAANWTTADPTLESGEVGCETDTGRLKVGDASTAWTSLAYAGSGVTLIEGLNDVDIMTPTDNDVFTWDAGTSMWSSQAATAGGFTPQVQPQEEDISVDGSNQIFISGQGKTYVYSGANTIIVSSAAADAGTLNDLTIDVDKDWNAKGILNATYLSGTSISAATAQLAHIEGTWAGEKIDSAQIIHTDFIISSNLNLGMIEAISGGFNGRLDTLEVMDEFDSELYATSANVYNRTWIDALSGSIDGRIDTLEGYVDQDVGSGTAPTFTADNFSDGGSNAIVTTTQETNFTSAYTWFTESGVKYSNWHGSGTLLGTAYNHSQDNTQAHTDYLLNSGDDSTSGTLTSKSFSGPLSGATISGGTITTSLIHSSYGLSSQISGMQVLTNLYPTRPVASNHQGEIIRTSGSAGVATYVYMAVKDSADAWNWMQMGITD